MTLNNEEITVGRFRSELVKLERKFRIENRTRLPEEEQLLLKSHALNQIVQDTLYNQEIRKNQIDISPQEFLGILQQAKSGYQDDSFEQLLAAEGVSAEEWENRLKNNALIKKLIEEKVNSKVFVSAEELQKYYQEHETEFFKPEQVRALHIMVPTEEEGREIQKLLQSKRKKFSELAFEQSLGPEGARGGDLGYFEAGQMPEEFDGVFKLKDNETSDVIKTPYGYHLFMVIDRRNGLKMTFEESRQTIQDQLIRERQDKAFQDWLAQLKNNADIKINNDLLEKIS